MVNQSFHRLQQSKNCQCLSFLNSPVMEVEAPNLEINRLKEAVASYILAWSKMERIPQKMLLMEKMKVAKGWKKTETSSQPFAFPFLVDNGTNMNNIRTSELLTTQRICNEALGAMYYPHVWAKIHENFNVPY